MVLGQRRAKSRTYRTEQLRVGSSGRGRVGCRYRDVLLQEVPGLGSEARMNLPAPHAAKGIGASNLANFDLAKRLRELNKAYERCPFLARDFSEANLVMSQMTGPPHEPGLNHWLGLELGLCGKLAGQKSIIRSDLWCESP
jgi:hypothetical protein